MTNGTICKKVVHYVLYTIILETPLKKLSPLLRGKGESFTGEKVYTEQKGGLQVCTDWKLLAWATWKWGILCGWLQEQVWLPLVAPKLET